VLSGESKVDKSLGITFHHYIKGHQSKGEKENKKIVKNKRKTNRKGSYNMLNLFCTYLFSSEFLIIFFILILSNYADIFWRCHEGNKVLFYGLLSTSPTKDIQK
jgi:hypothetical protein